jgi:hypothetical protein
MRANQAVITQTSFLIQCSSCQNCERSAENAKFGDVVKNLEEKGWKFTTSSYPIKFDEVTKVSCPACEKARKDALCKSGDIYDKLEGGYYEPSDDKAKYEEFKKDAIETIGLNGSKFAARAYRFAWEHGHAEGYSNVLYWLREVAEVVKYKE